MRTMLVKLARFALFFVPFAVGSDDESNADTFSLLKPKDSLFFLKTALKDLSDSEKLSETTRSLQAANALTPVPASLPWAGKLSHGSESHYPSLEEGLALMDGWTREFPGLLRKTSIGKSVEGRELWNYVLTDPSVKGKKPQFLLTSLTHSREPGGLVTVLYFVGRILTMAAAGGDATYFLRERETHIIPFVNPDGYVFNKGSQRMKRKNGRRTCPRVEDSGVDLNRYSGEVVFDYYAAHKILIKK